MITNDFTHCLHCFIELNVRLCFNKRLLEGSIIVDIIDLFVLSRLVLS